ncbi:unnamed protein product [Colias eurytheme]|nr:unnamed protein product [Colias eurytheme]
MSKLLITLFLVALIGSALTRPAPRPNDGGEVLVSDGEGHGVNVVDNGNGVNVVDNDDSIQVAPPPSQDSWARSSK